jgi:hypothetical protein
MVHFTVLYRLKVKEWCSLHFPLLHHVQTQSENGVTALKHDATLSSIKFSWTRLKRHRFRHHFAYSVSYSVVPINSSLSNITLYTSYNDTKYSVSRPTDATCDRFLFSIYMCITLHDSSVKRSSSGVPHRTYSLQFLRLCLSAARFIIL